MANKPISDNNDIIAFEEEKDNLADVEETIHAIASEKKSRIDSLQEKIDGFFICDNEDLQNKQCLMEERNSLWNDYDVFMEYEDSPYFGHFDMISGAKEPQAYFVGKKGLEKDGEVVILDWRSPMGNTFYNKREHKFTVKGIDYELMLRRAVNIQKAELISVNTEYDSVNLSLEGEVIDPFLISVLKDKRRNYKLTDIIRTIQMNQNDIIGKPIDENFIVQGCAGSGKTMILMHRLSFIAFNHPEVNFNKVYIITPNENFNIHVNDLSKSLGLDKIKRFTVESFYAELINSRSKDDIDITDRGKKVSRYSVSADGIQSEKLLNNEMLAYIYSEEYRTNICKNFKAKCDKAAALLNADDIRSCISSKAGVTERITKIDFAAYNKSSKAINAALKMHESKSPEYQESLRKLPQAQTDFDSVSKALSTQKDVLTRAKAALITTLLSEQIRMESACAESESRQKALNDDIVDAKKEKTKAFEAVKAAEEQLAVLRANKDRLNDLEYLFSDDDFAVLIREILPEDSEKIGELCSQLDKLAFYNFGRRSRLKAEISSIQNQLIEKAAPIIADFEKNHEADIAALRARIGELDAEITNANAEIADVQTKNKKDIPLLNAIRACLGLFENEEFPKLNMKSSFAAAEEVLFSVLVDYDRKHHRYQDTDTHFKVARDSLNAVNESISACEEKILDNSELSLLKKAQAIIEEFSITKLYKEIENNLRMLYKKYGQPYSSKANYRHRLYIKLLLASLYYGSGANIGYYVNIDEAQDLSVSEYKLLRSMLGNKAVFNLYGDVNQSVYEYKGISDWDEIADTISDNVYFLNENYRNTVEITNYCNEKFEAEVTAVGLSGDNVVNDSFEACLDAIVTIHKNDPAKRAAIIYRRGLSNVERLLSSQKDCDFTYNAISDSKISVITVEEAKGLEFDAVMVIENYMSINEQYVSYTRALDQLFITSIENSRFDDSVEEEIADDIDAEAEAAVPITENETVITPENVDVLDTVAENITQPSAELDVEPEDIPYEQWEGYIRAFFGSSEDFAKAFDAISDQVRKTDNDIILRVSTQYIGFAKANEKTLMYVARTENGYVIKYKHLYASEPFDAAKVEQYCKLYNQCVQYISKSPQNTKVGKKS